jgi:hypothetical protein
MTPQEAVIEWGLSLYDLSELYKGTSRHDSVSIGETKGFNHDLGIFNLSNYETQQVDYQYYLNNKKLPYLVVLKEDYHPDGVSQEVRLELLINGGTYGAATLIEDAVTFEYIQRDGIDYYYFFKGRQSRHLPSADANERADFYLILDFMGHLVKTLNWTTFPKSLIK